MRLVKRRSDKIPGKKIDTKITKEKYLSLKNSLDKLKNETRPREASEVKILSTTGDYSENAGYQESKARLRRTNNRIDKIEYILKRAEIIDTESKKESVEIGSRVRLEKNGEIKDYQILGSAETNPEKGLISYSSPLGSILLGKKEKESFSFRDNNFKILEIY